MKRIVALLLVFAMSAMLFSCGGEAATSGTAESTAAPSTTKNPDVPVQSAVSPYADIDFFGGKIEDNKGKRILIVCHSTATAYLLGKWCEISYDGDYKFNNQAFFDGKWDYLETFKLTFDDKNNLIDIKNI